MKINTEAVKDLIKEKFRNNKSWFAEVIGVDKSYLSQILNEKVNTSSFKVCNGIIDYCKKSNLDYNQYISL